MIITHIGYKEETQRREESVYLVVNHVFVQLVIFLPTGFAARDDRLRSAWDIEYCGGLCKFLREEIGVNFIPFYHGLGPTTTS